MEKTSFYLTGLTCSNCVRTVVRALLGIEGVDSAEVSNDYEWATVIFDPALTNPEEMAKAIETAGYMAEV